MNQSLSGPTPQLTGRWRITEMDEWDSDAIDLVGPGFIQFSKSGLGEFAFIAVQGGMDCRAANFNGRPGIEFSWEGDDEGDQVSGRGWAILVDAETIEGHIFFHLGMDSAFVAKPFDDAVQGNEE